MAGACTEPARPSKSPLGRAGEVGANPIPARPACPRGLFGCVAGLKAGEAPRLLSGCSRNDQWSRCSRRRRSSAGRRRLQRGGGAQQQLPRPRGRRGRRPAGGGAWSSRGLGPGAPPEAIRRPARAALPAISGGWRQPQPDRAMRRRDPSPSPTRGRTCRDSEGPAGGPEPFRGVSAPFRRLRAPPRQARRGVARSGQDSGPVPLPG